MPNSQPLAGLVIDALRSVTGGVGAFLVPEWGFLTLEGAVLVRQKFFKVLFGAF